MRCKERCFFSKFNFSHVLQFIIALCFLFSASTTLADVSWTGGVTKSPGDYTSDGIVTISGAVTFQPGSYIFAELKVISGGTLTIQGDTSTTNGSGALITVNGNVTIDSGGTITANTQGFAAGDGPGKGTFGAGSGAGAGYGGVGGPASFGGSPGVVYGSAIFPAALGSGAASGGKGGGAIKIVSTGTMTLNGNITANGGGGGVTGGGGSGGSIWLGAATLQGTTGTITATGGGGGMSGGGNGGGGRIFMSSTTSNTYSGTATANKGSGGNGGGVGTVMTMSFFNGNFLCDTAVTATISVSDLPNPLGDFTVENGCKLTVVGNMLAKSIWVQDTGSVLTIYGHMVAQVGNFNLGSGAIVNVGGDLVTGYGYSISAWNILIDPGATLTANGLGFPAGQGGGPGDSNGTNAGGGGHGGAGSPGNGAVAGGIINGNMNAPLELGSGGGTGSSGTGGAGGGAFHLVAMNVISIDGILSANGASGGGTRSGGGSGGSIFLNAASISGSGTISANGGAGTTNGGSGGGGRIAAAFTSDSFSGTKTATKGTGAYSAGANGTIVWGAPGAAAQLYFLSQPSSIARANEVFVTQPGVSALDANGNTIWDYSTAITLTAYTNASCTTLAGGSLSGGSATPIYGTGWYTSTQYNTGMTTIYLKATSGALTSACSEAINIGGAVATKLVFTTEPSATASAGVAFAQQPVVSAQDSSNNPDYMFSGGVVITAFTDATCTTAISGGTFNAGTSTKNLGASTFSGISYTKASTIYLKASYSNLTTDCSTAIVITGGAATTLAIVTAPSGSAQAGVVYAQQPVLEARDAYGNVDPNFAGAITFEPHTNGFCTALDSGGTLTGSSSTSSGVITFSGVSYTKLGTVRLKIISGGMSACTVGTNITAGPASYLEFATPPSTTGTMGVNLNIQPVVKAFDQYGNVATSYSTAITLAPFTDASCTSSASGTLNGSATTTSGVATFSNVRYSTLGTIYIKASSGALTPACSTSVTLTSRGQLFFRGF